MRLEQAQAEIKRLRQLLWECLGAARGDQGGQKKAPPPGRLDPDIPERALAQVVALAADADDTRLVKGSDVLRGAGPDSTCQECGHAITLLRHQWVHIFSDYVNGGQHAAVPPDDGTRENRSATASPAGATSGYAGYYTLATSPAQVYTLGDGVEAVFRPDFPRIATPHVPDELDDEAARALSNDELAALQTHVISNERLNAEALRETRAQQRRAAGEVLRRARRRAASQD